MKIGILVPHIFMQDEILPNVIFAPARLAVDLADNLTGLNNEVFLFTPGPVRTKAKNITADLSLFKAELHRRGDSFMDLLKKHPFTFITLARQIQSELIAKAYAMANAGELDIVHVYTNEEDTALPFAQLCAKPVVFTHHDPFNFLVKYKSVFPKYPQLNWISMSYAQRNGLPKNTNWVGNIYHGLPKNEYDSSYTSGKYLAYMGRIIQPKGLHLTIAAVQKYNQTAKHKMKLKIAGKHYAGHKKDNYWQTKILPSLDDPNIEYDGYLKTTAQKQKFLAGAKALIMPSIYEEPFGMVMIESLACGTPVIGLNSGAIPEIIKNGQTGFLVQKSEDENKTAQLIANTISKIDQIDRKACRQDFEQRFTSDRMAAEHLEVYKKLTQ